MLRRVRRKLILAVYFMATVVAVRSPAFPTPQKPTPTNANAPYGSHPHQLLDLYLSRHRAPHRSRSWSGSAGCGLRARTQRPTSSSPRAVRRSPSKCGRWGCDPYSSQRALYISTGVTASGLRSRNPGFGKLGHLFDRRLDGSLATPAGTSAPCRWAGRRWRRTETGPAQPRSHRRPCCPGPCSPGSACRWWW